MYIYEEGKIFKIIESKKPRGNVDDPFGLKRLFSCINIADKFLAIYKFQLCISVCSTKKYKDS